MGRDIKSNHDKFKKAAKKTIYSQFEYSKDKEKEKEKNRQERLSAMEYISYKLGLPDDILGGAPILTATGRNELIIENYKSIIEYNGNVIKIQTKQCRICIEGTGLNISYFSNGEMKITGIIHAISYK